MPLTPADFEEGEYRAPLFNQLSTTNLLWEPGQVFEKYIGIDHAMWSANRYILSLHGHSVAPLGVSLPHYDFDYIWSARNKHKKLPPFRLNLFIQAKRPMYGRHAPKALKARGIGSPYWRFELTPHQQVALERLHTNLKGRAIVCYACAAFHTDHLLHKWTVEPEIVEHSTFPDVIQLTNHVAWNFSKAGTFGVANAEPTRMEVGPLLKRLAELARQSEKAEKDISEPTDAENLTFLADAVAASVENVETSVSLLQARFREGVRDIEQAAAAFDLGDGARAFVAFATVRLFTSLYRLNWLVVGHASHPD